MHFRVSTRRAKGKVYRYGQLVQSYRRDDGMPAHRVIANLGRLTETEASNLKLAFQAAKQGHALVVQDSAAERFAAPKPQANLRYLDLAVLHHAWTRWGLDELIGELTGDDALDVAVASVVAALVVQRCVEPGSKRAAVDWFPTTALPELLGVQPGQFNNSRVHRTLDALDAIVAPLPARLAERIAAEWTERFAVLFLDCTDTWFVGRGPELASLRKTKEALLRNRIGIALLCDERGYPLRWATLPGSHYETATMMDIVSQTAATEWLRDVPIVMDRAMGCEQTILALRELDVQFITATRVQEFSNYSPRVPLGAFDDIAASDDDAVYEAALADRATELGFQTRPDGRRLLDLGVFVKGQDTPRGTITLRTGISRAIAAVRAGRRVAAEMERRVRMVELVQRFGASQTTLRSWMRLNDLAPEIVDRILAGEADRVLPQGLHQVACLPIAEQQTAFLALVEQAGEGPPVRPTRRLAAFGTCEPLTVRAVVVFSPDRFMRTRRKARQRLDKIREFVGQLNERLRSPHSRSTESSVLAAIGAELRRDSLLSVFNIAVSSIEHEGRACLQAELTLDPNAWKERRRADGINVIVAAPTMTASAAQLVTLYFAKDKVEKDFRTIKSVLELRPVYHHTDPKVRAHVTLCALALLLERTVEHQLQHAGLPLTAPHALTLLETCHLNRYDRSATDPVYTTTHTTADQRRILTALGLENLTDDLTLAANITPR